MMSTNDERESVWLAEADVRRITGGAVYPAVQRRRLDARGIKFVEDGSVHRRPLVLRALIEKMGGMDVVVAETPAEPDFSTFPKVA